MAICQSFDPYQVTKFGMIKRAARKFCFTTYVLWYIAPPTQQQDWRQLSALVAKDWESDNTSDQATNSLWTTILSWEEDTRLERQIYQYYVNNRRRMRGCKYDVLVAKEWGTVVGVAEMGMAVDSANETTATIGMICVDRNHRGDGIGKALIERCEQTSQNVWKESGIRADVEPTNTAALALFQSMGYTIDDTVVDVSVRRAGRLQKRPHVVCRKQLKQSQDETSQRVNKGQALDDDE